MVVVLVDVEVVVVTSANTHWSALYTTHWLVSFLKKKSPVTGSAGKSVWTLLLLLNAPNLVIIYPVVLVLVLVLVEVVVDVLVVVVLVLVDVLVEVVVDVLVVLNINPNQLSPEYLDHEFVFVLKYSSPDTGSVGSAVKALILPVMLLICVSAIYHPYTVVDVDVVVLVLVVVVLVLVVVVLVLLLVVVVLVVVVDVLVVVVEVLVVVVEVDVVVNPDKSKPLQ